jgi:hypothetical protein
MSTPGFNINEFAGEINSGGVAFQSHFMVVFTTPDPQVRPSLRKEDKFNNRFTDLLLKQGIDSTWTTDGYRNIAFRCDRVNIPGRIIISSPYKEGNYGLVREYPTNAVYQPVDCSFILSKDFSEKIFFETWQDLIVGNHRTSEFGDQNAISEDTKDLNYIDQYTTRITIIQFDNVPKRNMADLPTRKNGIFETITNTLNTFSPFGGGKQIKKGDPTPVYMCTLEEAYPRTIQDIQGDWGSSDIHRLSVVFDYKYFQDKQIKQVFAQGVEVDEGNPFITSGVQQGASVLAGDLARRFGLSQKQQIFLTGATTVARQVFGKVNDKFNII